ncbi:glycosyltransferase family 4 protein [Microbacterium sp. STN6]|nr:glycosyltransferase family 4 protein [Microbacterium sp. STN6]
MRDALQSPIRLTYIGRLSPRKGVDVAVEALALLARRGIVAELDLIGDVYPGYEWYERQLREQIAANGLEGRVRFNGFQPSIWASVGDGDIVVVPSRGDEPFGNTAVEGILAGRPIIVSNTSGLIEAAAGYSSARMVRPNDPQAVASAVQELVAEWSNITTVIESNQELAHSRHSADSYQKQIVELVDLLVGVDQPSPALR